MLFHFSPIVGITVGSREQQFRVGSAGSYFHSIRDEGGSDCNEAERRRTSLVHIETYNVFGVCTDGKISGFIHDSRSFEGLDSKWKESGIHWVFITEMEAK